MATQLRNLRLDLQRYQMLKSGDPVDPNPILDRRWTQQTKKVVWLNNLLKDDVELKRAVRAVNDKAGKSFLK